MNKKIKRYAFDLINGEQELIEANDGKVYAIPFSNHLYAHIPVLPSECDEWIRYFQNLRDHFTDDEVNQFNEKMYKETVLDYKGD